MNFIKEYLEVLTQKVKFLFAKKENREPTIKPMAFEKKGARNNERDE